MRARLASTTASELGRRYVNFYASTFPEVRALADPVFDDHAEANVVVAHERYELPGFFKDHERDLEPWLMHSCLRSPKFSRRQMPLAVPFPRYAAHHIHVVAGDWEPEVPSSTDVRDDMVRFRSTGRFKAGTLSLDYEYEALADAVPAEKVPAHLALLERVGNDWSYTIREPANASEKARASAPGVRYGLWVTLAAIGFASVAAVLRRFVRWRRRRVFRKRATFQRGEAPTNAIVIADAAEIDAQVSKARCACRARLARKPSTPPTAEVKLGGRTLHAVPVACEACGETQRLYFELRAGG
jgi:hypothetical protein